jgi:RNA polymerase sigma-70 factor (ECF subfamily)
MKMDMDYRLIREISDNDMNALGLLAKKYQKILYGYAFRTLGNRQSAEDVVQDTFLRVAKNAHRYKPQAKVVTWLFKIAHNLCVDRQRKMSNNTIPIEAVEQNLYVLDDRLNSAEQTEFVRALRRLIKTLPPRQRMVLMLYRYSDLSHTEISQVTGWSLSSVESLIVRAYANLRRMAASDKILSTYLQD